MTTLLDQITVLGSTSPIPSHPDPAVTFETLASLPPCEAIVMADGVREEQEHRRADYEEYLRRLLWRTNLGQTTGPTTVLISDDHRHQAGMTAWALEQVTTPLVLYIEHDAPLVGEVPWADLARAILTGKADVVRLASESSVLDEWRYLMCGEREVICGQTLWRTAQWSQRPHLASTSWYRNMLAEHFPPESRTFIEDKLYGEIATPWVERKEWGTYCRLFLFAPDGDMKRSTHLDGRGTDPKYELVW